MKVPENSHDATRHLTTAICQMADLSTFNAIVTTTQAAARRLTGADGVTFVLRDGSECHYLDEDAIAPLWKGRRFPLSDCISGWAMTHRQQVVIRDVFADPRIPADAYEPTFVKSLVMTPVGTTEPWAALGAYWSRVATPAPEAARWLQALADSTALALENVRIRARLAHHLEAADAEVPDEEVVLCAWTNRLLWHGTWISVERYFRERFGLAVTHGISDEAARVLSQR